MTNKPTNIQSVGALCSGCGSCAVSCPQGCIVMADSADGFVYPKVNTEACIECGICIESCGVITKALHTPRRGYAMWHKNKDVLRSSSSGGAFMAAAQAIISESGTVFGCVTDAKGMPVHSSAESENELMKMQGSKYCQSNTTAVYPQVKKALDENRTVLFTGTPCEVAGLYGYLRKPYDNLFTMDLICHGVPSPRMYADYLVWLGKKYGGEVRDYNFRSKNKHDWSLTTSFNISKNGKSKRYEMISSLLPYDHGFLSGIFYRESCYSCPFAQNKRVSDITIGDYWGVERVHPELYNSDGVSCMLVNTEHGEELIKKMEPFSVLNSVLPDEIIAYNGNLRRPSVKPQCYDEIMKSYREHGFDYIAKVYCKDPQYIINRIKDLIPNHIRQSLKKALKRS